MKKILSNIIVAIVLSFSFVGLVGSTNVAAQTVPCKAKADFLGIPAWYDGLECNAADGNVAHPNANGGLGNMIWKIVANIIGMLLYIVGLASIGFIIFGGFKYMINGDNESGIASAKKTILNAVIGLILSIMSVAIVKVITTAL